MPMSWTNITSVMKPKVAFLPTTKAASRHPYMPQTEHYVSDKLGNTRASTLSLLDAQTAKHVRSHFSLENHAFLKHQAIKKQYNAGLWCRDNKSYLNKGNLSMGSFLDAA